MAYERLDPFGEERADLRAGIVASTVANANRGKKGKRLKPEDFMPHFGRKPEQTPEEQLAIWKGIAAAHNERIKGGGNQKRRKG